MNDFPESVYVAYVDGELDPAQEREFALHLMRSADARRRVVALQEEATLLRDALQERERISLRPAVVHAPARGLALGIAPALAAVVAVMAGVGWLLDLRLPGGFEWLNPRDMFGVYAMFFDLIFWLRDEAPQLIELLIAVVATVACSALLTFVVTAVFRRFSGASLLALALLGVPVLAVRQASAVELHVHEEKVTIPAGEVVSETLVVSGHSLYVDGVVDGDVAVVAERAVIRGEVRGDVFAFVRSLEISGRVGGSVRAVGERVDVDGRVERDVTALGDQVSQTTEGYTGRDFTVFGENVAVDGEVGRHLFSGAERLEVRGSVAGNADLFGDRALVLDGARIGGNLSSRLEAGRSVEISPGAVVVGSVSESRSEHDFSRTASRFSSMHFYLHRVVILASAMLVGLFLYAFAPGLFGGRLETAPDFFRSLGFGLGVLVGAPIAIGLCAVTVVGIPIALFAAWLYVAALFVAFTLVGALLGRTLMRSETPTLGSFGLRLAVGLLVLAVAISLPWIGTPLTWLALLTGLGLLAEYARQRAAGWRRRASAA